MTDKILFAEERRKRLVEYINDKRRVTGAELCDAFNVSSATIRNDLRELDEAGYITRTHGGAIRKSQTGYETEIESRVARNVPEKNAIAELALKKVSDGDTIILDGGTTICEFARYLKHRKHITVVTNDLKVAGILESHETCDVIVLGGLLRKGFHCTISTGAEQMLSSISVDKAFMGTNSFSLKKGASTPDVIHASMKREMIKIAANVILLCDHTKLERDSFMGFASADDIDLLITDTIAAELRTLYEENDISILTVDAGNQQP